MRRLLYFILPCIFLFTSCRKPSEKSVSKLSIKLITQSKTYLGTPYGSGGSTAKAMDCSGFIFRTFSDLNLKFPRMAYQQASFYKEVEKDKLKQGDLVYFVVFGNTIDHTGIVVEVKSKKEILFIHASSSKGVRIDNLYSPYWLPKFVKATRPEEGLTKKIVKNEK